MKSEESMTMDVQEYYRNTYRKKVFPLDRIAEADLRIADGLIPLNEKILSIGCSTGSDVEFLLEKNKVYGIDILADAITEARKKGIEAIEGNVEEGLPYKNEQFDIVVCKDVLEHLFSPQRMMQEIHRVLKPEGYAIVNVPNHFYYRMRFRLLLGKGVVWFGHPSNEWDYFHIRFFTLKGFNEFLRVCGFRAVKFFFDIGTYCYSSTMYYDQSQLLRHRILKFLFPSRIRSAIARIRPNLLCASFYAKIIKEK